jgi:co-chaperonin GroES (HSP10)
MILPQNDYVLIEPIESEKTGGVVISSSMQALGEAIVVAVGPDKCILNTFEKGMSQLVRKSKIYPNVKPGARVRYLKMAEERMTADAAYRTEHDGKFYLLIKITDLRDVLP